MPALSLRRADSLGKTRLRREWEVIADEDRGAGYYNCLTRRLGADRGLFAG